MTTTETFSLILALLTALAAGLIGAFALFLYVGKQQATESPEYSPELTIAPPPGLELVEPRGPRQVRVKLRGPAIVDGIAAPPVTQAFPSFCTARWSR